MLKKQQKTFDIFVYSNTWFTSDDITCILV